MKKNRPLIIFTAMLISFLSMICIAEAQTEDRPPWDKSIESQFNYLIDKSSKYEDYRVIKSVWFFTLRTHVLDTLKGVKKKLRETQMLVLEKERAMDTLKSEMQNVNNKFTTISKEKNSIRFLGILMAKYYYNSLMWSIVVGLFTLLLIFIMLFRRSNVVTVQTKHMLAEAKEEFETHRKRSREREEKLARQYLDELNKYKSKTAKKVQ